MPIYEYYCPDCRTEMEVLRSFDEADEPLDCDQCGGGNVSRKLSLCFAHSDGGTVSGMGGGCSSCAGGDCGSCG